MAHLTCMTHNRRVWVNPDSLRVAHREDHSECLPQRGTLKIGQIEGIAPWEVAMYDDAPTCKCHRAPMKEWDGEEMSYFPPPTDSNRGIEIFPFKQEEIKRYKGELYG